MKHIKTYFPILLCLLISAQSHADEIANILRPGQKFYSENKKFVAVIDEAPRQFIVYNAGKETYRVNAANENFKLGTIFVSNDGMYATWILDPHFLAHLSRKSEIEKFPALIFYKQGASIKEYNLLELLVRPNLVSWSVSHTNWIPEEILLSFSDSKSELEFTTTSFRYYRFNFKTGEMIYGDDTQLYKNAELIVNGTINKIINHPFKGKIVNLKNIRYIKGELQKNELDFIDSTNSYTTIDSHINVPLIKDNDTWKALAPIHAIPTVFNIIDLIKSSKI